MDEALRTARSATQPLNFGGLLLPYQLRISSLRVPIWKLLSPGIAGAPCLRNPSLRSGKERDSALNQQVTRPRQEPRGRPPSPWPFT